MNGRVYERMSKRASVQVSELYRGPSIHYEKSVIFQRWKRMVWFYKTLVQKIKTEKKTEIECIYFVLKSKPKKKIPFEMESRLHFAIIDDH